MNRFHVHLSVSNLDDSIRFYSQLFATAPAVVKPDYAKWMLEDPRVNFAISITGRAPGVDHLGIQVDDGDELVALGKRLDAIGSTLVPELDATCCYARSDKLWTEDPQGTRWETFHTAGDAVNYCAANGACVTDGAACSPKRASPPMTKHAGNCCAPQSGCC